MGKKNIIIITACIIFIVFSGIIYLQPGDSASSSFTGNTGADILKDEETVNNKDGGIKQKKIIKQALQER